MARACLGLEQKRPGNGAGWHGCNPVLTRNCQPRGRASFARASSPWRRDHYELLQCYGGRPPHPVMVALQPTMQRFGISPTPFLDLLTAFEQDQRVKRYRTYDELLGYCRYSANPVGHLILYLAEVFEPRRAQ